MIRNNRRQDDPRRAAAARREGSTLVAAVVAILIVSMTLITMSEALGGNALTNDRRREAMKALQAADAGIALALDFFHRPERYDADLSFGVNPFVHNPDDISDYEPLTTQLESGDLEIDPSLYPLMNYGDTEQVSATLSSVVFKAPPAGSPAGSMCLVESTAVSRRHGISKTVQALLRPPRSFDLQSPAALVSFKNTVTNGNVMVHWGEAWAKGTISLETPARYNDYGEGPTVAIRSMKNILFPNSGQWRIPTSVQSSATIQEIWPHSTSSSVQNNFTNRLYQNQADLKFPEYDYQTLKDVARQFGSYYSTDSSGNIYRNGVENDANLITIDEIINNAPEDPARFVFIDTTDSNPPDTANRSNMTTISITGTGEGVRYMRGFYYIGANLDIRGIGSSSVPLAVEIPQRPDNWPTSVIWPSGDKQINVISDGVCVITGDLQCTGQPQFYGSLVSMGNITGGGTPNVYYNPKLTDGLDFPLLSRVEAYQWRIVR